MKKYKIIFWSSTLILCALMLFSATMYFTQYEMVEGFYRNFGYPTYLITPLAIAKVLGVLAITSRINNSLMEWAYAGFFFDLVLAIKAHYEFGDSYYPALIGLIMLLFSYFSQKKAFAY